MPAPLPVIELSADELFARMHRFVASPLNNSINQPIHQLINQFLHSVGGLSNLFEVAIASEHPDTQAFVLKVIDKVLSIDYVNQSMNQLINQSQLNPDNQPTDVLSTQSINVSINQLFEQFLIALKSDDSAVQSFVVSQLVKHCRSLTPLLFNQSISQASDETTHSIDQTVAQSIVHLLLQLFCHGDTEILKSINQLFVLMGRTHNQLIDYLFNPLIQQAFFARAELTWPITQSVNQSINLSISQSIIVLRVISLYIDVSCINANSLSLFHSSELINFIKQSINQSLNQSNRDILYQLNCVELLDKFIQQLPVGSVNQSVNQLVQTILTDLVDCLIDCLIHCQSSFLLVSFITVIESLSKASAKQSINQPTSQSTNTHWQNDPRLKQCLLSYLSSDQSIDETALVACLNCAAVLATSHVECVSYWLIKPIDQSANQSTSQSIDWSLYLTSTSELIQLAAIGSLTIIFSAYQSLNQSNSQSVNQSIIQPLRTIYTRFFYQSISQSIDQAIKLIWGPFYDQKLAMLKLARALLSVDDPSIYQSIIKLGLIDRLIDRLTGDELEVRREKYECVKTIMNNPLVTLSATKSADQSTNQSTNQSTSRSILSPAVVTQLREFVRQGPLYVERTAAVMQPLTRGSG